MTKSDSAPRDERDARQRRLLEKQGVPYQLLVESVKDYAICMLDPDGRVTSWNPGAERIKGYTADEIIGKHFSVFFPREDVDAGKPKRLLEQARTFGRFEDISWRVRKDGTLFWANVVMTALRSRDGELVGFVKVTRDMTAQHDAEQRLQESEERFRLLVDSVKDYAIFMIDPAGRVMSWNSGAQRIKGYTADEIIGKHFSIFYPPEDAAAAKPERLLRAAAENGRVEDEGWRMRKDGTRFFADVVITAVWDDHGGLRGYSKVTRDITEKRAAEAERAALLEARVRAEETNRAKDEFLMTLSHELRTPMTAITGWARLLNDGSLPPEEVKLAIKSILDSALAQATIIDDVLDVSRLMTGKVQLHIAAVNPVRLAQDVVDALTPAARAKHIDIVTDFESGIGDIAGDADRMRQIIWNLLSNAVKFSPKQKAVTVRVRRGHSTVDIVVDDCGSGVPPEVLPYIFRPFVQADSSATRRHGGLGLGLTIVRNLAELHGGSVSVANRPEGGASFSVSIPIAAAPIEVRVEKETETAEEQREQAERVRLDGAKILFVDDHAPSRQIVTSILTRAGAKVETAASVREAVDLLKNLQPDLVITDIGMPEEDGFALAEIVRGRQGEGRLRHVPVVAFTAFGGPEKNPRSKEFDGWLKKPMDPIDLVNAAARFIGRIR